MIVSLSTNTPEFAGDLSDVARLFLGAVKINAEGNGQADLSLEHQFDQGASRARADGGAWHTRQAEPVTGDDPRGLLQRRAVKRACKQSVYEALKAFTGKTPPWGSLTGIRPTQMLYEGMARGLSMEDSAREAAREFDISPEKAALALDVVRAQARLKRPAERDIDLYIGIPFCPSRCAYCSFLSGEVGDGKQLEPYVSALETEIARMGDLTARLGLSVRALYMGGGTPTALSARQLERVLDGVARAFPAFAERTVEAGRPDSITEEKLAVLSAAGIRRISVNPQTASDDTLSRIGRRHTAAQTEQAYRLARGMGFTHINMDLIAGLPGEQDAEFTRTLDWVRALAPDSLTVHTLCIKRASLLHEWAHALPSGDMTARMTRAGREAARAMGMQPYYLYRQKYMAGNLENVAYATPGHECLYNVDIMEDAAHILALGAGGISKRLFRSESRIERSPNVADVGHYIRRVDEMSARKEALFGSISEMKESEKA